LKPNIPLQECHLRRGIPRLERDIKTSPRPSLAAKQRRLAKETKEFPGTAQGGQGFHWEKLALHPLCGHLQRPLPWIAITIVANEGARCEVASSQGRLVTFVGLGKGDLGKRGRGSVVHGQLLTVHACQGDRSIGGMMEKPRKPSVTQEWNVLSGLSRSCKRYQIRWIVSLSYSREYLYNKSNRALRINFPFGSIINSVQFVNATKISYPIQPTPPAFNKTKPPLCKPPINRKSPQSHP
jgi:hypothetical protein